MIPIDEIQRGIGTALLPAGNAPLRVADPMCGDGTSLHALANALRQHGAAVETFACEEDPSLAAAAASLLGECMAGHYRAMRWKPGVVDILLLSPSDNAPDTLRETQEILRLEGLLVLYVQQREALAGPLSGYLATHFAEPVVWPCESAPGVIVLARRKAYAPDKTLKAKLTAVATGASSDLLGCSCQPLVVQGRSRPPFYLRPKTAKPTLIAADARRFGVMTSAWWQERMSNMPHYACRSIIPLRLEQIANLMLLGFVDNHEFDFQGDRFIFKAFHALEEVEATTREDLFEDRRVMIERSIQGGRLVSLRTGVIKELDARGVLQLVRAHPETFACAVTDKVSVLRPVLTLEPWEEQALRQVYRFKRLPGRAEPGLTSAQMAVAAAAAQAIESGWTRVVVFNEDTGTGKTGQMFGSAMCLRHRYMERKDYLWFAEPWIRGGHRRRRMRMPGCGGSHHAWMRNYRHRKPFCIAFAAERLSMDKMAREIRDCLPLSFVYVAERAADVDAFVKATRGLDPASIAVLLVPKTMAKLGAGWKPAAVKGIHGLNGPDASRPYHCPNCSEVITVDVDDGHGGRHKVVVNDNNLAETLAQRTFCPRCNAPLFQECRVDLGVKGAPPVIPCLPPGFFHQDYRPAGEAKPPPVRYPVAEYIWRRYRDFFDVTIWDEAHDANGAPSNEIVAAYRYLTSAARLGWLEATASNMNGYASSVFTRAYHSSPEVRRRFRCDEVGDFVASFGLHKRITRLDNKRETSIVEYPGVQPALALLLLPYTVVMLLEDLGAPLPPRLEECQEIDMMDPAFGAVVEQYRALSHFDTRHMRRAEPSKRQALLGYLNAPWNEERITVFEYDDAGRIKRDSAGNPIEEVLFVARPTWDLYDPRPLPKEAWLLEYLERSLRQGVGVSILIAHIGRGIEERLRFLIAHHLHYDKVRYCAVEAGKRQTWYNRCVRDGIGVIISGAGKLKQTLDLLAFPHIVFYQPLSDPAAVIQAKGRAYRLGQTRPCETHFLYYGQTEEHQMMVPLADKIVAYNLLRGGELAGGLLDMGHQVEAAMLTRRALELGNLPHLGTLLRQGAIGEWLPPERIAEIDAQRREARAKALELEKVAINPVQLSLF